MHQVPVGRGPECVLAAFPSVSDREESLQLDQTGLEIATERFDDLAQNRGRQGSAGDTAGNGWIKGIAFAIETR
jgi:hypothetical protein